MGTRRPSAERRDEVIQATLDLLAEVPLERITTRRIAERIGVSQPALFRHFESRDDLIVAAVAHTREELAGIAEDALDGDQGPLDRAEALVSAILSYVGANPGVPRLLFQDAVDGGAVFREPLGRLIHTPRQLFAGLVRDAQGDGSVGADVDAEGAARLLVALVQGTILQWQLAGRDRDLGADGQAALALWRAGVLAGEPRLAPAAPTAQVAAARTGEALVSLDVRDVIAKGGEPLPDILAAVERLAPDGVLVLTAPFRPAPLLRLLGSRGFAVACEEIGRGRWQVEARGPEAPEVLDLRDLPAPEPLERMLAACAGLGAGGVVLARTPLVPYPLLPLLADRGLVATVHEQPDGTALIHVRRP